GELLHVVQAIRLLRFAFGFRQGGQQHRGENRDDRNNNQQFDQGETANPIRLSGTGLQSTRPIWFYKLRKYYQKQSAPSIPSFRGFLQCLSSRNCAGRAHRITANMRTSKPNRRPRFTLPVHSLETVLGNGPGNFLLFLV